MFIENIDEELGKIDHLDDVFKESIVNVYHAAANASLSNENEEWPVIEDLQDSDFSSIFSNEELGYIEAVEPSTITTLIEELINVYKENKRLKLIIKNPNMKLSDPEASEMVSDLVDKIRNDPDYGLSILKKAGILNKSGELTKPYGGKGKLDKGTI